MRLYKVTFEHYSGGVWRQNFHSVLVVSDAPATVAAERAVKRERKESHVRLRVEAVSFEGDVVKV